MTRSRLKRRLTRILDAPREAHNSSMSSAAADLTFQYTDLLMRRHSLSILEENLLVTLSTYVEHICQVLHNPVAEIADPFHRASCLALASTRDLRAALFPKDLRAHDSPILQQALAWASIMLTATGLPDSPAWVLGRRFVENIGI